MSEIPYPPSWQNRFFDALGPGAVPGWLKSVLLFGALTFVNHLAPWVEGKLGWGAFDPYQLNFHVWFLVVFLAGGYFFAYSDGALHRFQPAFDQDEQAFRDLRYRFIHISSRSGWAITLAALAFSPVSLSLGGVYQQTGLSAAVLVASGAFMFSLVFFFFIFLMRALGMVRRLYREVGRINIFHLEPLYAFSGFTSRVGMFLVLAGTLSYVTNITLAQRPQLGTFAFFLLFNGVLALTAFIFPLGGIHERLRHEKEQVGVENDLRLERAFRELHVRVDRGDLAGMTEFRGSISSMLDFRNEIRAVSTWPWGPGTLRNFLSALLLPIVLFLLQAFLADVLAL